MKDFVTRNNNKYKILLVKGIKEIPYEHKKGRIISIINVPTYA